VTEQTPEPYVAQTVHESHEPEPEPEEARANNLLGLALFGVFVLLFGGTVLVGLLYLAFD
jgi:hypothetical protein